MAALGTEGSARVAYKCSICINFKSLLYLLRHNKAQAIGSSVLSASQTVQQSWFREWRWADSAG